MKRAILMILCLSWLLPIFAQEEQHRRTTRRGDAAGYSSGDATTLSMMGWGVGLAVGIATFFALMDNNSTHGH